MSPTEETHFFSIYALGSLPLMHDDLISSVGLRHTMTLEVKQRERKKGASNKQQTARKKERQFIEEKP